MNKSVSVLSYRLFDIGYRLRQHKVWLTVLLLCLVGLIVLNLINGQAKASVELHWLDIWGEGLSVLMVFIWFIVILSTRAPGKVTHYFSLGFTCVIVSLTQDFIDEFIRLPSYLVLGHVMESMFIGVSFITYAFVLWRKEFTSMERYIKERYLLNPSMPMPSEHAALPDIHYLHQVLARKNRLSEKNPDSIISLKLENDLDILHQLSASELNLLRLKIAEFLCVICRRQDVICHGAAHRYLILVRDSSETSTISYMHQLEAQLGVFVFYLDDGSQLDLQWGINLTHCYDETDTLNSTQRFIDKALGSFSATQKI
ncbi:MAG: hypothetical protein ACPHV3_01320 [Vibrio sp.]